MRFHLPRRRAVRAAIHVSSLLLVLVAVDLVLVQVRRTIRHGFETTRIVLPLQSDGRVDYLLAIDEEYARGVTSRNNAAVLLLEALGRRALAGNQPPDGITDRLGMPHLPEAGSYFVPLANYLEDHGKPGEQLRMSDAVPYPVTISPNLRAWVQANEGPLNLVVEASQRSRFFIPAYGGYRPETLYEIQLPYLAGLRDACLALRVRTLMRLEAGDAAGVCDDLLAAVRLGRLLTQSAMLIDRLVGFAVERSACRTARAAAVSGKLPPETLRILRDEFARLPETSPMIECINTGERYGALDLMQTLARVGPKRASELIASTGEELASFLAGRDSIHLSAWQAVTLRCTPIPYERSMRLLNGLYDGVVVALCQPTFARRRAALALWEEQIARLGLHEPFDGIASGAWPVQLLLPPLAQAQATAESALMDVQLARISLALAMYRADHRVYPVRLADLVPGYLSAVPDDRFTEKPLIYEAKAEGYRLYSVGPDGIDQGGAFSPPGMLRFSGPPPASDDVTANWP